MSENRPDQPLPLTVIGGWLGAGKTTLVNRILAAPGGRRLMVLVNDFGEIAIDAELIASRDEDVVALSNGCVCCAMAGDFARALAAALDRRPRPGHLVIEASGVADPMRLAAVARAEPELALDGVIVMADAEGLANRLADARIAAQVGAGLEGGDLILLNRVDLAGAEALRAARASVAARNPTAPILETVRAEAPLTALIGLGGSARVAPPSPADHGAEFMGWSHRPTAPFARARLEAALSGLGAEVLRLKGLVEIAGEGPAAIHKVGARLAIEPLAWRPPEWGVVAIGIELDLAALDAAFMAD